MEEIYSHFITRNKADDNLRIGYMMWFSETFPRSEFSGEDLIMKYYCDYSSTLSVPMRYEYFNTFLSTELRRILIDTGVHITGTDTYNYSEPTGLESAYLVTKEYMQNEFRILESCDVDVSDFKVAAHAYMSTKLSSRLVEELGKTYETLSSSDNSKIAADYALDNLVLLRDIYDPLLLEELDDDVASKIGSRFEFLVDTGIKTIDDDITGLYTHQLFGIEAQPGTGKTRFLLGTWAYRAAVLYKRNVIYYQLEQSKVEAQAMLVARHVFTLYNIQIPSEMIEKDKVPEEYKAKVATARIDLFDSGKYGKIYIARTNLYVETLTQTFRKDNKLHGPFDIIAIDYMGLIGQRRSGKYQKEKEKFQIIDESLRKFKNYVELTAKGGIAVSQFNDKGIVAGKSDKEINTNMAEGGIAVYRHTDQNLALSRTKVMEARQQLRISQPKIRGTAGFGSMIADTRLGFCYIYQNATSQI